VLIEGWTVFLALRSATSTMLRVVGPVPDALIVAREVTKSFRLGAVDVPVLRGVTLEVERGTFVAIVGPSGGGKTTLLSLLGALDAADSGTLVVDGHDLRTLAGSDLDAYRRETIGVVLQFYNLLPSLSAVENVETGLEFLPLDARRRRTRALDYLDRVGLADAAFTFPAQMSGGMQQRVAVARALAKEPRLLLADEPTGNLDQENGAQVFEHMRALQEEMRITCVMVTHDRELAAKTGHVVAVQDGRVVPA
jgi:putative ABC transport system ATP-binding protein